MVVELNACFDKASGTFCKDKDFRIILTTRRAPSNNPNKVRMYFRSEESYKRKQPFTDAELAAQELFTRRQAYVKELITNGKCKSKADAWKVAKKTIL